MSPEAPETEKLLAQLRFGCACRRFATIWKQTAVCYIAAAERASRRHPLGASFEADGPTQSGALMEPQNIFRNALRYAVDISEGLEGLINPC